MKVRTSYSPRPTISSAGTAATLTAATVLTNDDFQLGSIGGNGGIFARRIVDRSTPASQSARILHQQDHARIFAIARHRSSPRISPMTSNPPSLAIAR